jgi:hypothetical protein
MTPPVTVREVLEEYERFLARYMAFPSEHEAVAVALWIVHAHAVEHFETSPVLAITSAEKRSGKTRLLDCLEVLVPNPYRTVTPSEAVTYTVLSQRPRPTLLLDEADAIFGPRTAERYEGLRAILNAGNRQGTPVLRVKLDGRRREIEEFDIYGPKAVAGIGKLPDTVADRAIPIRLKRRAPSEPVARFRRRTAQAEADAIPGFLVDEIAAAVTDVTVVTVPEELNDRAADSWEALLWIAECAGATWPVRARLAAVALSGDEDIELTTGIRLLTDVRDIFDEHATDHLATGDLLAALTDLDEAPWGDWYGKPLTARGLAKLLEPYRVMPHLRRIGGSRNRGYFRSDFTDSWSRYLPVPETVTTVTSVPPGTDVTGVTGSRTPTDEAPLPFAWWDGDHEEGAA